MDLYPDLTEQCPKLPKTERNNARVVLHLCEQSKSVVELMEATGYESRTSFRRKILSPLLEAGLLKPVLGDKNSPKQRYILQWSEGQGTGIEVKPKSWTGTLIHS